MHVYYQTSHGERQGPHLALDPYTRQTVNVADTVPDEWGVSTRVVSGNPVIAERAMYWNRAQGAYRQGAHASIGVTDSSTEWWFLAEGSTGIGPEGSFETWVLIQNPGDVTAEVDIHYQTPSGEAKGPHRSLKSGTRASVNVADTVPGEWSVSAKVISDEPVIAERAMYWNTTATGWQAAHNSIGYSP